MILIKYSYKNKDKHSEKNILSLALLWIELKVVDSGSLMFRRNTEGAITNLYGTQA